jgi:PBP1b-binding outer membrane lipoprotein LpoB
MDTGKFSIVAILFATILVFSGCTAEQQNSASEVMPTEAEEYSETDSEGWNPSTDPSWEQYNL